MRMICAAAPPPPDGSTPHQPLNKESRQTSAPMQSLSRVLVIAGASQVGLNDVNADDGDIGSLVLPEELSIAQHPPTLTGENNTDAVLEDAEDGKEIPAGAPVIAESSDALPSTPPPKALTHGRCRKRKWNDPPTQPLNTGSSVTKNAGPPALKAPYDVAARRLDPPLPIAHPQHTPFYLDDPLPDIPFGNNPGGDQNTNNALINGHFYFRSTTDYQRNSRIPLVVFDGHYIGRINISGFSHIPIYVRPYQDSFKFVLRALEQNLGEETYKYRSGIVTFPRLIDPNTFQWWIEGEYLNFQAPQLKPLQMDHVFGDGQNMINPSVDGRYFHQAITDYQENSLIPIVIVDGYYRGRISNTRFRNIPINAWPHPFGFEFVVQRVIHDPNQDIFHYASGIFSFPLRINQNTFHHWIEGEYLNFQAQIL